MNEEQLKIIKRYKEKEKYHAEQLEGESFEKRQSMKKFLHSMAMDAYKRAVKPKNPNPPKKLTNKACSPDCVFCHPSLVNKT